jgi:hypothetical protein
MGQATVLFVGAMLLALGVIMWGMRAGYWLFVVRLGQSLLLLSS